MQLLITYGKQLTFEKASTVFSFISRPSPRSPIFTWPSFMRNTFAGFRSRCSILRSCM